MILRLAITGAALFVLSAAARHAPLETGLSAGCTALVTYLAVTWRTRPILQAARELATAFCFTNRPCIDEIRAVSKAVLLWGR